MRPVYSVVLTVSPSSLNSNLNSMSPLELDLIDRILNRLPFSSDDMSVNSHFSLGVMFETLMTS